MERLAFAARGEDAIDAAPVGLTGTLGDQAFRGVAGGSITGYRGADATAAAQALTRYRFKDFTSINAAFRGSGPVDRTGQLIEKVTKASPLRQEVITHRVVNRPAAVIPGWRADMTGAEWVERAPSSTAAQEDAVRDFIQGRGLDHAVKMRLLVPAGVGAVRLSSIDHEDAGWDGAEGELLLQPGLRYRVIKDRGQDAKGVRLLDVEILPG